MKKKINDEKLWILLLKFEKKFKILFLLWLVQINWKISCVDFVNLNKN
jgi:hypothetical protein